MTLSKQIYKAQSQSEIYRLLLNQQKAHLVISFVNAHYNIRFDPEKHVWTRQSNTTNHKHTIDLNEAKTVTATAVRNLFEKKY